MAMARNQVSCIPQWELERGGGIEMPGWIIDVINTFWQIYDYVILGVEY
jgi:hypothetical protein